MCIYTPIPNFNIQKKTPASNFYTIHKNLDLDLAKEMLVDFAKAYDADDQKSYESSLDEDGMILQAYDQGDLHSFRIVKAQS